MREGDVALVSLPQADGRAKPRPVILLRQLPPFADWLLCGVSTQLQQQVIGFDDLIEPGSLDFRDSGLKAPSLIRLGFLASIPPSRILGVIGSLSPNRHRELLQRLRKLLE